MREPVIDVCEVAYDTECWTAYLDALAAAAPRYLIDRHAAALALARDGYAVAVAPQRRVLAGPGKGPRHALAHL